MATTFKVTLKEDADKGKLVETLKAGAKKEGVDFTGNTESGRVSGKGLDVNYKVEGNIVTVNIVKVGFPASLKHDESSVAALIKAWLKDYAK